MSLFKVRDWWSTRCGSEEEFDKGCLCVGNIDNQSAKDSTGVDKIVTGSFSGILRIYKPVKSKYQVTDLLIEQRLDGPIIQLEIGKFVPGSQELALAVLTPRKLAVYTVQCNTGMRSQEDSDDQQTGISQYSITKIYDHDLDRLTYNFTYGPFGGAYGKDFFCIQSFDGQLAFYEQDHFVFSRFLPNFLLPGPILYNKGTDSFITFNSAFEVESYKYQVLATSSASNEKDNENSSGKKVQVDWSINIGEEVYDIKLGRYGQYLSASQSEILVLGERTLYCVKENGKLSAQKRLDYFPSTMLLVNQGNDKGVSRQNLLIASHNKTLMVYRDPKLIWAAGTNSVPVAITLGSFGSVKGFLVLLDDVGNLSVNYLGTDAVSNPVPTMESKEIDYHELEEEHRKLQSLIKQTQNAGKYEPTDKLLIRAQVPTSIDQDSMNNNSDVGKRKATINLYLGYTGERVSLQNITLNVSVQSPFSVSQSNVQIESLQGGSHRTPLIIPIIVYGGSDAIPTSLQAEVMAVYHAPTGEPRTTMCEFVLPISLAGELVSPKKISTHKITIDTNRMPPPMSVLFEDLVKGSDSEKTNNGSILTFQYSNGQDATILVSKNAGRYRIQSGDFEALWLLTSELIRRLDMYFNSDGTSDESDEPYSVAFSENLPFHQYFDKIDEHFNARLQLHQNMEELKKLTFQFRSIQKRLLIRFKDRNPTPINNMDLLLDQTYQSLVSWSKKVESSQQTLQITARNLSCSTSLMLLLLKLKLNLPDTELAVLRQYLSPVVVDSDNYGWEEVTEAGMTYLLRTVLAKSPKDHVPSPLQKAADTTKLKKHVALVYDRISKGMSLYKEKSKKKKKQKKGEQNDTE